MISLLSALLMVLLLIFQIGCAGAPKPSVQLSTTFVEADHIPYAKNGTGSISGQAFLKTVGGDVKYGAGSSVFLIPNTPYYIEYFKHAASGHTIQNIDPKAGNYVRQTVGDGQGKFEFVNVPPGEYILLTEVTWGVPTQYGIRKSGGDIVKSISMKDGDKLKILLTR
ncbi:MAG: hypothetical protein ACYC6G_18975 [Desulfobaccales bacterium]